DDTELLLDLLDVPTSSVATTETANPVTTNSAEPLPEQLDTNHRTPSGEHFIAWLRQSIQTRKLIINDAKALVHTIDDTAYLVSPGVFQRYAQEHPQVAVLA